MALLALLVVACIKHIPAGSVRRDGDCNQNSDCAVGECVSLGSRGLRCHLTCDPEGMNTVGTCPDGFICVQELHAPYLCHPAEEVAPEGTGTGSDHSRIRTTR